MKNKQPDKKLQIVKKICKDLKKYTKTTETLMQVQHKVSNILGFKKWNEMIKNPQNINLQNLNYLMNLIVCLRIENQNKSEEN